VVVRQPLKQKITFELSKENIAKLRQLSRDDAIPPSMLVDQMLLQDLANRASSSISEYIPIRKVLLSRLLEKFSEKEVSEIARSIARVSTRKIIQRLRRDYHIMSSVDVVDALIRISNLKYTHEINHGIHRFTITHDLEKKWSLYLFEIYSSVLHQFKFRKIDISFTDRQLTFTVILRSIL